MTARTRTFDAELYPFFYATVSFAANHPNIIASGDTTFRRVATLIREFAADTGQHFGEVVLALADAEVDSFMSPPTRQQRADAVFAIVATKVGATEFRCPFTGRGISFEDIDPLFDMLGLPTPTHLGRFAA